MYSTRPKLSSFSKHPSRLLSRAVAASRPCIQSIYLATRGLHVVLCVCVCVCWPGSSAARCVHARPLASSSGRPSGRPVVCASFHNHVSMHLPTQVVSLSNHMCQPICRSGQSMYIPLSLSLHARRHGAAQRSAARRSPIVYLDGRL